MFCNGMVVLHDGRVFINGGNLKYDPFWGEPRNEVYDPATGVFTDVENMAHGAGTHVTTLGDGSVMTFSGLRETGGTNTAVEIYTVGSGWSPEFRAGWTPPLYPRMHLSTDGRVFYAGRGSKLQVLQSDDENLVGRRGDDQIHRHAKLWHVRPAPPDAGERLQTARDDPRGGNPATATTEIIDLSAPTPQWAVRTFDVPAADSDERDHPPEREGAGDRRIEKRRGCRHREPECRYLRPGYEHVQFRGSQLSFRASIIPTRCSSPMPRYC